MLESSEGSLRIVDVEGKAPEYPKLKVVSVESGIGWVPFLLEELDYVFDDIVVSEKERGYAQRRPVALVHSEFFERITEAIAAERQVKRWSRAKKEALIAGDFDRLKDAARRRQPFGPHPSRRRQGAAPQDEGKE